MELLRKQPGLRVPQLAAALGVSQGTIRNDLNALDAEGRLTRFHGGALLREPGAYLTTTFSNRLQAHLAEKRLIAGQAAALVEDGDSLFLDASSTAYTFAAEIQDRQLLRVVTNGLDVARLLAHNPSNTVILIGGGLSQDGSSVTGLLSEQAIQDLRYQKAFVSCSGFTLERGLTEVRLDEAQLKRKALGSATQVIALVDSSKFGKEDLTSFARPDQVTLLFTDGGLPAEWAARLYQAGLNLMICSPEAALAK